jgi:hypothetical protein
VVLGQRELNCALLERQLLLRCADIPVSTPSSTWWAARAAPMPPLRPLVTAGGLRPGRFVNNLLVDGMLLATWWIEHEGKRSAMPAIRPSHKLSRAEHCEVAMEARRMIDFAAPDVDRCAVRFEPAVG